MAFSPEEKILASGGQGGTVRLWDVASHEPPGDPFTGHAAAVGSATFSPEARAIVSVGDDATIRIGVILLLQGNISFDISASD